MPNKYGPKKVDDVAFGAVTDSIERLRNEHGLSFEEAKKVIKKAAEEVNECETPKGTPCPHETD